MSDLGIEALKRAIKVLGGQTAVARLVDTFQPTVHRTLNVTGVVPAEWCIPIDIATAEKGDRVSCHELRPDLWPADFLPEQKAA